MNYHCISVFRLFSHTLVFEFSIEQHLTLNAILPQSGVMTSLYTSHF